MSEWILFIMKRIKGNPFFGEDIMQYIEAQTIAKNTIEYIRNNLRAGMTLLEVRNLCETKMIELGADSFWYWDVGAFVFSGDETVLSVSGRDYATSERIIAENDIITIDLSPQNGDIWGDYARTIIIENGKVVETDNVSNVEWKTGLLMEEFLHKEMCKFVTPKTTFEELYYYINCIIDEKGYIKTEDGVHTNIDKIYVAGDNKKKLLKQLVTAESDGAIAATVAIKEMER